MARLPQHHINEIKRSLDERGELPSHLSLSVQPNVGEIERSSRDIFVEHIPDPFLRLDKNGRYLYVNLAASELIGRPAEEILGKTYRELGRSIPQLQSLELVVKKVLDTGQSQRRQFISEIRGVTNILDWHVGPEFDGKGGVRSAFAIARDITDCHLSGGVHDESQTYRTIVEMFPHAILIVQGGTFVFANRAALQLFSAKRPDELIGQQNFLDLEGNDQTRKGDSERSSKQFETKIDISGGRTVPVEVYVRDIEYQAKSAKQVILVDISDRKKAEQERKDLESQMVQTQKLESLGVLAGGIAHDFNNLLMGVLGHADIALRVLPKDAPAQQQLRKIVTTARRSAELCQQLLAYSGQGNVSVELLDLRELVEEMAHLLNVSISKNAILEFDFAEDLPAIEGDASQLRQVVLNLIVNASDAIGTQSGYIRLSIDKCFCSKNDFSKGFFEGEVPKKECVRLQISDTGRGMDDLTRRKIFDPFFTTKKEGRGLGLAAVLGIVRSHKSAIKVDSHPGKGTTFTLFFPALKRPISKVPEAPSSAPPWSGSGTILVVDDEPNARRIAQLFLEEAGFNVLMAEDGVKGFEVFKKHSDEIVAVVLDLTMPRMGGEETFKEFLKIRDDIPVILSSGYSEEEVTQRFSGQPWAGFIQKPYRFAALVYKLRDIL